MFRQHVGQIVASQGGKEVSGQQAVIKGDSLVNLLLPLIDRGQHQGEDGRSLGVGHLRFQLLQGLIGIGHLLIGQGQQLQGGQLPGVQVQGFFQRGDGGLGLLLWIISSSPNIWCNCGFLGLRARVWRTAAKAFSGCFCSW